MTNDFENQLDKIRVELYDRTKAMANKEVARATNENAKKIAAQYGIKITRGIVAHAEKNGRAV